jgi:ketosteroid isomerase-like protein
MNDIAIVHSATAVRRAVDRLLEGAVGPMLDLLAEDVEFEVATDEGVPGCRKESGKPAVGDYFTSLGGMVAFWQMDYTGIGQQVIAWGKESFTVEGCGLQGGCEFALVLDLAEGMITRFRVIEDLRSFIRGGGSLGEVSGARARAPHGGRRPLGGSRPDGAEPWSSTAADRVQAAGFAGNGPARLK